MVVLWAVWAPLASGAAWWESELRLDDLEKGEWVVYAAREEGSGELKVLAAKVGADGRAQAHYGTQDFALTGVFEVNARDLDERKQERVTLTLKTALKRKAADVTDRIRSLVGQGAEEVTSTTGMTSQIALEPGVLVCLGASQQPAAQPQVAPAGAEQGVGAPGAAVGAEPAVTTVLHFVAIFKVGKPPVRLRLYEAPAPEAVAVPEQEGAKKVEGVAR